MNNRPLAQFDALHVSAAQARSNPMLAGRIDGAFHVDPSGQASYEIPIKLPPGTAGFQPDMKLVYNHRQRNGVIGVGWELSGLSAITRCPSTYAVDGHRGAVTYTEADRLCIDGQRLINVVGEYAQPGTTYRTELESWRLVCAATDPRLGFTVTTRSGEVLRYGDTPDSRILVAGGTQVRLWALSSITDKNGNSIAYAYSGTPLTAAGTDDEGMYYLKEIRYTIRNDAAAKRSVCFDYEQRPDVITSYIAGHLVKVTARLSSIAVLLEEEVVRTYQMSYQVRSAKQRSRLESITESGAASFGAPALPPTRILWHESPQTGLTAGQTSMLDQQPNELSVATIDVNGDGRADLVQFWHDGQVVHATVYLATELAGGDIQFIKSSQSALGAFPLANHEIVPMDVDGDGCTDLVIAYRDDTDYTLHLAVFLWRGDRLVPGGVVATGDAWMTRHSHLEFFAADVNGDGRTDLVEAYVYNDPDAGDLLYLRTYLSRFSAESAGFSAAMVTSTTDAADRDSTLAFWAMDVNGDGIADLVRVRQHAGRVLATSYIAAATELYEMSFAARVETDLGPLGAKRPTILPADVNGDGMMDLLWAWQESTASTTTLHLSTFFADGAGGFVPGPDSAFADRSLRPRTFDPLDVNGDGITDLASRWVDESSSGETLMMDVYVGSPSGHYCALPAIAIGEARPGYSFLPADINADGRADMLGWVVEDATRRITPYISKWPLPDLVATVTDGLGSVVELQYAPLSNAMVYNAQSAALGFPRATGLQYAGPTTPTRFPIQTLQGAAIYVVSQYLLRNDALLNRFASEVRYEMTYAEAQVDLLGRGWQGFRSVSALNTSTGRRVVTQYNQEFPTTGTVATVRIEVDDRFSTDPRSRPGVHDTLLTLTATQYAVLPRAVGATFPNAQVVEVVRQATSVEYYDYGQDRFDYALGDTYQYDDFGNITTHANLGYVDRTTHEALDPAASVYRHTSYRNDVDAQHWRLGLPLFSKTTSQSATAAVDHFLPGDYSLEAMTYVESSLNLASHARWDSANGAWLVTGIEYDGFGNMVAKTLPGGAVSRFEFDPDYHSFPVSITAPATERAAALTTYFAYDPRFGVEVARQTPDGVITIRGTDAFGRATLRQGPPQQGSTIVDVNALGSLATGSLAKVASFRAAQVVTLETIEHGNDNSGGTYIEVRLLQAFPSDGTRDFWCQRHYIDAHGRQRLRIERSGNPRGNIVVETDYDPHGNPVRTTLPRFEQDVNATPPALIRLYDVLDRPRQQHTPIGRDAHSESVTTWTYMSGEQVAVTAAAGSNNAYTQVFTTRHYDGHQRVIRVVVPEDGNATTLATYDPLGRLLCTVDPPTAANPSGVSSTVTHDSLNRKLTVDDPDQNPLGAATKAAAFTYSAVTGRIASRTDAAGKVTRYQHDALGRKTRELLSDGRHIEFVYDDPVPGGLGRLTQVSVRTAASQLESRHDYQYDAYGNLASETLTLDGEPAALIRLARHDPQRRVVWSAYPNDSTLTRKYECNRLVSQRIGSAQVEYPLASYSSTAEAASVRYTIGAVSDKYIACRYSFNPAGQLYEEQIIGPAQESLLHLTYEYDGLLQLTEVKDATRAPSTTTQAFLYHNRRLRAAHIDGFDPSTYDYDASGNLVTKDGIRYQYRAHFAASGSNAEGQQVFAASPDACGRTASRARDGQTLQFSYDGLNRLERVTTESGAIVREALWDYRGRPLRTIDGAGNAVIHVGPNYRIDRPRSGMPTVTQFIRDSRGVVASLRRVGTAAATVHYYRCDPKGSSTLACAGSDGQVVGRVAYDAFGRPRSLSGSDGPLRYERRDWEEDLGLYCFGARYYDPQIGRFLTPDSGLGAPSIAYPDALNRYAFELNDPIAFIDPTGHMSEGLEIALGVIAGVTLIAVGAALAIGLGAAPIVFAAVSGPLATAAFSTAGSASGGLFIGAGLSATVYSTRSGFNVKNYFIQMGIGGATGLVSGLVVGGVAGFVPLLTAQPVLGTLATIGFTTLTGGGVGAGADVLGQTLTNIATGNRITSQLGEAALLGGVLGGVLGAVAGSFESAATIGLKVTPASTASESAATEMQEMSTAAGDPSTSGSTSSGQTRTPTTREAFLRAHPKVTNGARLALSGVSNAAAAVLDAGREITSSQTDEFL